MYNGKFMNTLDEVNKLAQANGYVNGISCAEDALNHGVLNKYDFNAFSSCHNLRNLMAHGSAMDINISAETMKIAEIFLDRVSDYIKNSRPAAVPSYVQQAKEADLRTLKEGDIIILWKDVNESYKFKDSDGIVRNGPKADYIGEIYLVQDDYVDYEFRNILLIHRCGGKGKDRRSEKTFDDWDFLDEMKKPECGGRAMLIRGAKIDIPYNYHYVLRTRALDDKNTREITYVTLPQSNTYGLKSGNEPEKTFVGEAYLLFPEFFREEAQWPLFPTHEDDSLDYLTDDLMNDRHAWYECLVWDRQHRKR